MAKLKKVKKGDKKKISKLDGALEDSLAQGADNDSYSTPTNPPSVVQQDSISTPPPSEPRKKQVKEVEFPRTIVGLFTEAQYAMVKTIAKQMKMKDGGDHSMNKVIRVAVEKLYADFDK